MRNIKELLQVMLDNQELFKRGLCGWNTNLYFDNIITSGEYWAIAKFIEKNNPSVFSSFDAFICTASDYYWTEGSIKPRIKWIKKHLK